MFEIRYFRLLEANLLLLIGYVTLAAFIQSCQNGGSVSTPRKMSVDYSDTASFEGARIEFDTLAYNFGRVYEGEKVEAFFKFRNTGNKSLILKNVRTSCGCTIPEYSMEPVAPGGQGKINIVFDTYGKTGYQYKTINVETNGTPGNIELNIVADVTQK